MTTRILPFLVGNPYKPSFVTVTGWGVYLTYTYNPLQLALSGTISHEKNIGDPYCISRDLNTDQFEDIVPQLPRTSTESVVCYFLGKTSESTNPENTKLRPTATFQHPPLRENAEKNVAWSEQILTKVGSYFCRHKPPSCFSSCGL